MAKKFRPSNGVPSANQKIVSVNQAQGFGNMGRMQGTTRVIYDSVPIVTSATSNTYNIFENCKTRSFPLTNLTENKLQVGETMALQKFSIYIMGASTGTTNVTTVVPLGYFTQFQRLYASVLNFAIAQDQVIKRLPLTSMFSPFNPNSKFMGYQTFQPLAADPVTSYTYSQDIYHMDTNIVLPPQIEFVASIQVPAITSVPAGFDWFLTMKWEGVGSLYAPKSTY